MEANILPFKDGLLTEEKPVIIAGLGYVSPWTRDAAINTWNAGGLICPEIVLNALNSVLNKDDKGYFIDGEYWNRIIWTQGAWQQYLYTGNKEFLQIAYEAVCNSLKHFENTEFSQELNLFRGAACYGDGVAAYPNIYAKHGESGIIVFASECRDLCEKDGVGIPIYSLSTNCLYYQAYVIADKMAEELCLPLKYSEKAQNMKKAINKDFWNDKEGKYNYIYDKFGGCDYQEGLGISFAILFGIADDIQKKSIFENYKTTPYGIPCVFPSFERYNTPDGLGFGRHSGTVWPHVQGFWADAVAENGRRELFDKEFMLQTQNALRYYQFAEIYHPLTGEIYGGRQERDNGIVEWRAEPYQTWSATAYLRNVYMNLIGMNFSPAGIKFMPIGSHLVNSMALINLKYKKSVLNITVNGSGNSISSFTVNGKERTPFIGSDEGGELNIVIILK